MKKRAFVLIQLFFLLPAIIFAQENINNFTIGGVGKLNLKRNSLYLNINGEFPQFIKVYNSNLNTMVDFPETNVTTEAYLNAYAQYGFSDKLNFFVDIPFKWLNHYNPNINQENKGFGDIELGASWQAVGSSLNEKTLGLRLSITAPVGEHSNLSPYELPLGEGVWQITAAASGMIPLNTFYVVYFFNYTLRTKNSADINLGDQVAGLVSAEKELNTEWGNFSLVSGVELSNYFDNSLNGTNIPNSSEFSAHLFGGIGYYYQNNLRFSFTMPFTIYKIDGWLTDYSAILKIEYSLDIKN